MAMVQDPVGWLRLWGSVMNYGIQHTRGLQMLSRLMSNHGGGQRPCPLCESSDLTTTVLEHVLLAHGAEMGITAKTTCELLKNLTTSVSPVAKFRNLFNNDTLREHVRNRCKRACLSSVGSAASLSNCFVRNYSSSVSLATLLLP